MTTETELLSMCCSASMLLGRCIVCDEPARAFPDVTAAEVLPIVVNRLVDVEIERHSGPDADLPEHARDDMAHAIGCILSHFAEELRDEQQQHMFSVLMLELARVVRREGNER